MARALDLSPRVKAKKRCALFSNNAAGRKTAKRWNRGPYHLAAPAAEKDKTRTRHQTKTGGLGDDVKGSPECSGSLD